jgi:hypothetical protein
MKTTQEEWGGGTEDLEDVPSILKAKVKKVGSPFINSIPWNYSTRIGK